MKIFRVHVKDYASDTFTQKKKDPELMQELDKYQTEQKISHDEAAKLKLRCRGREEGLMITYLAFKEQGQDKLIQELKTVVSMDLLPSERALA